jgi:MFS family permease
MTALRVVGRRTFYSLRVPNYRRYFFSQIVSMSGTWMQSVAQMWLVYQITGSSVALGLVTSLQFAPVLVAGMWGGIIADRVDKRKVIIATQAAAAALALILGVLTVTGAIQLWMIYALAFAFGCVAVVEVPARQSFVVEMVGPQYLSNAVGLNSTVFTSARVIGPALAGILIATVGIAWCFLINAASYLAVIAGMWSMDPAELHRSEPVERSRGQLREGLRYVWSTPILRLSLLLMAIVGTLAFNFRVILPVMAGTEFGGGAGTYGALSAFMGGGTVIGALFAASRTKPTTRMLIGSALAYGLLIFVAGAAPTLASEMIALVPMGAAGIAFVATANSTLQLNSSDAMRGRVMALYSVVFLGSTPIGGPIAGWVVEQLGVRAGFWLSGVACLVAGALAMRTVRARRVASEGPSTVGATASPDDATPAGTGQRLRGVLGAVRYALRK